MNKLTPMNKVLTGLVLALMLAGCTRWSSADIEAATAFCTDHQGLRYVEGPYLKCNDGESVGKDAAYRQIYKGSRL